MNYEENPKGKKCIKIKLNIAKFKNMVTLDDFFKLTGLDKYLENGTIYDVRQTFINEKTGNDIYDCWKKNWKKNKQLKMFKEKYAMSVLSFNWMNFSPCFNEKVPEGYLYIYPKKKPSECKK